MRWTYNRQVDVRPVLKGLLLIYRFSRTKLGSRTQCCFLQPALSTVVWYSWDVKRQHLLAQWAHVMHPCKHQLQCRPYVSAFRDPSELTVASHPQYDTPAGTENDRGVAPCLSLRSQQHALQRVASESSSPGRGSSTVQTAAACQNCECKASSGQLAQPHY